jgi:hypothetical protein
VDTVTPRTLPNQVDNANSYVSPTEDSIWPICSSPCRAQCPLPGYHGFLSLSSWEECATNCYNNGFTGTAGTENGEECWCSNDTGGVGSSASSGMILTFESRHPRLRKARERSSAYRSAG